MHRVLFFVFLFGCNFLFAQYNQWTWLGGATSYASSGNYGTMGIPAPGNIPSARYEASEWQDNQGNFWLYGGLYEIGAGYLSDMWKYNPSTNQWTWMSGSTAFNVPPSYGTKGVASPTNTPGGRGFACITWADNQGNFWLFGGISYQNVWHNDLWKYDPTTNLWTWVSGTNQNAQPGVYGTKGIPSVNNYPGARSESDAGWVDAAGNFWLFGGAGYDFNGGIAGFGHLNDMWRFNPTTNEWTWMSGDNTANNAGIYGTLGIAAPTNKPGARNVHSSWKDNNGNFWVTGSGGFGQSSSSSGFLNDLWMYNPTTNEWTWEEGNKTTGSNGSFGAQCVDAPTNQPRYQNENRVRWTDDCGNFWMFGSNYDNALWTYSHKTKNWKWVSGASQLYNYGNYGTMGVSSAFTVPGYRGGGVAWRNIADNNFYFFGGARMIDSTLNDLWKYEPDKPTALFDTLVISGCNPLTIKFNNQSTPGCNEIKEYKWFFDDPQSGANNTSTEKDPQHSFYQQGTYSIKLVVVNCTGSKDSVTMQISGASYNIDFSINPTPPIYLNQPEIQLTNLSSNLVSSSWMIEGKDTVVTYADSVVEYTFTDTGYYCIRMVGLSEDGCSDTVKKCITVLPDISIFVPNTFTPDENGLNEVFNAKAEGLIEYQLQIYNRWGELIYDSGKQDSPRDSNGWNGKVNNMDCPLGVYIYKINFATFRNERTSVIGHLMLLR